MPTPRVGLKFSREVNPIAYVAALLALVGIDNNGCYSNLFHSLAAVFPLLPVNVRTQRLRLTIDAESYNDEVDSILLVGSLTAVRPFSFLHPNCLFNCFCRPPPVPQPALLPLARQCPRRRRVERL